MNGTVIVAGTYGTPSLLFILYLVWYTAHRGRAIVYFVYISLEYCRN